ncbi:MAG: hypothetical protein JWL81_2731, partial [Verrucomicrobiales bacterium]|nr:hypothetical protein [Verrucomicrobiales bacterium]
MEKPFSLNWFTASALLAASTLSASADPVQVIFQQGQNDYAGTVDMRLRAGDDQNGSVATAIAFDGGSSTYGDAAYALGFI